MTATTVEQGRTCKPNISEAGRRLRVDFGWRWLVISVIALVVLFAIHAPWYWRALLFLPAAISAVGFLQARNMTCVSRAAEGTFEHQDLSRTRATDSDVAASRRVASRIWRQTVLIGIAAAAVSVVTAALR